MRNRVLHIALFTFLLVAAALGGARPPKVIKTTPAQNASGAPLQADVRAMFGMNVIRSTINDTTFILTGSRSGRHRGTVSYDPSNYEASLSLVSPLICGETVQAVLPAGGVASELTEETTPGYTWTFTAGASNGTCEFTPDARTLHASGSPAAVTAADIDGDGFTDLVAANPAQRTVDIFLNTKRQAFASAVTCALNLSPAAVACADLDGDGRVDIVAAGDSSIAVIMNEGGAKFSAAKVYAAGPSVTSLFLADVDNDGAVDCAVTNSSANTVTILKNDGKGAFTVTLQTIAVQGSPCGIALADLNNDGLMDGLVCSRVSNTVTVLRSAGPARLAADSVYTMHTAPAAIVSFDFDNDGFMDFATANSGSNDISIMLNNAGTGFIGPGNAEITGLAPSALAGGDFDGDGDIDLAVACPGSNTVVIMQNNGYAFPTLKSIPAGAGATGVAVLEMSGKYDILDVASANAKDGTISILKNTFFLPPRAELTLSAEEVDFPKTPADSACTFVIKLSAAFSPLTVDSVTSVSGMFSSSAAMPCAIPSYGSVDLPVVFAPRAAGTFSDTLTIWSTAGVKRLRVTGTSPDITLSSGEAGAAVPAEYSMSQNYPNPFNPSTTISFSLPAKTFVTLKVYDLMGREAAVLASEEMPAGTHTRQWNAAGMPSGVYFYQLKAGPFAAIRRLLLLK